MEYIELVLIPLLIGVLEGIKRTGFNTKFIPLLAILLGLPLGIVYSGFDVKEGIIVGILIGLSSVGLYSSTKSTITGVKKFRD